MITAIHTLVYSDDAPGTRAFLRDVLGLPHIEDSASEPGWLIFRTGPSEMGVHPTHSVWEGKEYTSPRHHEISVMCDDIESTRAELEAKEIAEQRRQVHRTPGDADQPFNWIAGHLRLTP
jgi:catechol 2,3-dioxygenase-like lactoylglutathione lyase family enzyme